jgi:2,3-bisphosphoglycerate-dependent phosphoglycerate mutase
MRRLEIQGKALINHHGMKPDCQTSGLGCQFRPFKVYNPLMTKPQLILLRHGESEWNRLNLFTGWTDVALTAAGEEEAKGAGRALLDAGIDFDCCFCSYLSRARRTLELIQAVLGRPSMPATHAWQLNERHYGKLQGLNKASAAQKYGSQTVRAWRRGFHSRPPALSPGDSQNPKLCPLYRGISPQLLPLTESLADAYKRVVPYYQAKIEPELEAGRQVLVVAHGNTIRALRRYLESLDDEATGELPIPTGIPCACNPKGEGQARQCAFLGDPAQIAARVERARA